MASNKIISFDVGIKHLAYCVLTTEPETPLWGGTQHPTLYQIPDWQIINLLDTSEANVSKPVTHTCCANALSKTNTKTKPKICQKKALYHTPINPPGGGSEETQTNYFCKKHAENHPQFKIPNLLPTKTEIAKMSIEDLRILIQQIETQNQIQNTNKIETFFQTETKENQTKSEIKTKKACIEKIEQLKTTNFFQLIPQTKKQNASHTSMLVLCQSLYNKFNQLATQFENATHVIIENQLGSNATRMMILQGMITMYFTAHISKPTIAHVSSSHKLKYAVSIIPHAHQPNETQSQNKIKEKTTYKEHKQNAVLYCEQILEMHNQSQTQMFKDLKKNKADEKKRDDLADCFLQGLWYLSTL
jgi:hypothetical protein